MDEAQVAEALLDVFQGVVYNDESMVEEAVEKFGDVKRATSYEEGGYMTRDKGLVVRMEDGTEFQITVVRSA